ncbi:MAG: ABC transporter substrate-binding protein [Firmicutes bacterium]|nr:ABC transporter substrate-binding protein [Bacillota bacterium]
MKNKIMNKRYGIITVLLMTISLLFLIAMAPYPVETGRYLTNSENRIQNENYFQPFTRNLREIKELPYWWVRFNGLDFIRRDVLIDDIGLIPPPFPPPPVFEIMSNVWNNPNPIMWGGTLRVAAAMERPFSLSIFDRYNSFNVFNTNFRNVVFERLVTLDSYGTVVSNIAEFDICYDNHVLNLRMNRSNPSIYWHDGVPFTLDDLVFTLETMQHPDMFHHNDHGLSLIYNTPTTRFWQQHSIVGARDFTNGYLDYIPGLVLSDDRLNAAIYFDNNADIRSFLRGLADPNAVVLPRHRFEGISVADMPYHPYIHNHILGNGAFIMENTVPGESVSLVANEKHWRGRPQVDAVIMEVIDPGLAAAAAGQYDIILNGTIRFYEKFELNNGGFLGRVTNYRKVLIFNFSDNAANASIQSNPFLRRAIGYAIFDYEKANYMLDSARFMRDRDGFRRMPWGDSAIKIYVGEGNDEFKNALITVFNAIGLHVEFISDSRYNADIFFAKINALHNCVSSLFSAFSKNGSQNFGNFYSESLQSMLDNLKHLYRFAWHTCCCIESILTQIYYYIYYNMPSLTLGFKVSTPFINNRVANVHLSYLGNYLNFWNAGLTASEPYRGV